MLKHVLSQINSDDVISIYCDRSQPETHLTGFVGAFVDDEIIIQHISKSGLYDGFVLIHTDDIFRLDYFGEYEQKIQALYRHKKQTHPLLPNDESLLYSLLRFAKEQDLVLSAELEDSTVSGYLVEYDYDYIHLKIIDECGKQIGNTVLACEEIISFAVDTSTEQDMRILYLTREPN